MSGSTGQTLGYIVGAIVGYFIPGGNVLVGAAIGSAVGGLLDPPKGPTLLGPRLSDLSVQSSTYGANLPHIHGTVATMGNVFWLEGDKIKETPHKKKSGGKGGGGSTQKTWTYSATFAVGLCSTKVTGPIAGIRRIWVQGNLFYDAGSDDIESIIASNNAAETFAVYLGTEDQMPDPRMQADKGVANTPAYRGRAYVVFYDLQLAEYGNSLMGAQVKVEVVGQAAADLPGPFGTALDDTMPTVLGDSETVGKTSIMYEDGTLLVGRVTDGVLYTERRTLEGVYLRTERSVSEVFANDLTYTPVMPALNNQNSYYANRGTDATTIVVNNHIPCETEAYSYANGICDLLGVTYAAHDGCIRGFSGGAIVYEFRIEPPATTFHLGLSTNGEYLYACFNSISGTNPAVPHTGNQLIEFLPDLTIVNSWDGVQLTALSQGGVMAWPIARRVLFGTFNDEEGIFTFAEDGTFVRTPVAGMTALNAVMPEPSIGYWWSENQRWTFEQPLVSEYPLLSEIVQEECLQASDLSASDLDVTALTQEVRGYRVTQTGAIRAAIEPLQGAWPFDIIQSGYKIKAVNRGGASVATIDAEVLDARPAGDAPGPAITIVREMDTQLPRRVTIKHIDLARDYDNGEQAAERLSDDSIGVRDMDMPIVLTAGEAAQKAEVLLYLYWLERHTITFKLPPEYLALEPADVITITTPDAAYSLRLTSINYLSDGRLECVAKYNSAAVYTPAALGEEGLPPTATLGLQGPTGYELMDIPALSSSMDEPLFLAAMAGYVPSWPGGILFRSADGGQTWADLQGWSNECTMGSARNAIGAHTDNTVDSASLLQIDLIAGELESITELAMLNGGQHFAYGADGRWEICAARTCTLQGDGSYLAQDMLRGRAGTEWATGLHIAGDAVVLLNDTDIALIGMETAAIGLSRLYRGVTAGRSIDSAADREFTYRAVNLECLSPVYFGGSIHPTTADWTFTWVRRTRLGGEWRDLIDVPLSETTEAYEIDVHTDSTYTTVARTLTSTTTTVQYTSAQQLEDFGAPQSIVYVSVYQMSATVGRGYALQGTLISEENFQPVLQLPMTGTEGGTTFTDLMGHGVTVNGDAQTTTANPPDGVTSSGLFDGTGDYLTLADSADWDIGGEDFTIEAFVRVANTTGTKNILSQWGTSADTAAFHFSVSGQRLYFAYRSVSTSVGSTGTTVSVAANTWAHVAVCHSSGTTRLFVDGIADATTISMIGPINLVAFDMQVGRINNIDAGYFNGQMAQLRFEIGFARYTENFTPPTLPLPTP